MEWIAALIKHITASNKLMVAILTASTCIVLGPHLFPQIHEVPQEWRWVPQALAIFSAVMLGLSFLSILLRWITQSARHLRKKVFVPKLDQDAYALLQRIFEVSGETIFHLDIDSVPLKHRLPLLAARDRLIDRGLIEALFGQQSKLLITKEGRKLLNTKSTA